MFSGQPGCCKILQQVSSTHLAAHLLKILQVIGHCDWEIISTIWTTDSIEEYVYEIEISPPKNHLPKEVVKTETI